MTKIEWLGNNSLQIKYRLILKFIQNLLQPYNIKLFHKNVFIYMFDYSFIIKFPLLLFYIHNINVANCVNSQ